MQQVIQLKYINFHLQIGLSNWPEVYLLQPQPVKLIPEVDHGRLVYRAKGSVKRIGYATIKKGLIRRDDTIVEEVSNWLLD